MTMLIAAPFKAPQAPAVPYPRIGVGVLPENPTNQDYLNLINSTMTESISGATFTLNDLGTEYMYFASPVDHGDITFVDIDTNVAGGWDGASWPSDGSTLETVGKVEITLTVGLDTRTWYLYRTDYKGLGVKTFKMLFNQTPTSLKQVTDEDPGIGWGDINTAVANAINIVVDGPVFTAKMEGGQYLAFRYVPLKGKNHVHNAIGAGNVGITLYDGTAQLLLPEQNINNGPNGSDEIDYKFASKHNSMLLIVHDKDTEGTIADFGVNVASESFVVDGVGYIDEPTATSNVQHIELNTEYNIRVSENLYATYHFDSLDGKAHEIQVVAKDGGPQDVEYWLYQNNAALYGPIDLNTGPGGKDEIGESYTLSHLTTGLESTRDDINLVLHTKALTSVTGAVFTFNSNPDLTESGVLFPDKAPDSAPLFGRTLDMSDDGNLLVVSSTAEPVEGYDRAGVVYSYKKVNGTFTLDQLLVSDAPEENGKFGFDVSISGDGSTLAVGAFLEDANDTVDSGIVRIYKRVSDVWTLVSTLSPSIPTAQTFYGRSISLSYNGSVVAVGATKAHGAYIGGCVYVYTDSGSGYTAPVVVVPEDQQADASFGSSVALSDDGTTLVVGSPVYDGVATDTGAVYVYKNTGTWTETKLTDPTGEYRDYLGYSVDVDASGNKFVVSAYGRGVGYSGRVYVYEYTGSWALTHDFTSSDIQQDDYFGVTVRMSSDGGRIVASSFSEDTGGSNVGSVYVFDLVGNVWTEVDKIQASTSYVDQGFGLSFAASASCGELAICATRAHKVGTDEYILKVVVDTTPPEPMFGTGAAPINFNESEILAVLTDSLSDHISDGYMLSMSAGQNQYMYFAVPADYYGYVQFTDAANGYVGGWDGATWPSDGNIGTENGPVRMELTVNGNKDDWYVYRTDFPSLGSKQYMLNFSDR